MNYKTNQNQNQLKNNKKNYQNSSYYWGFFQLLVVFNNKTIDIFFTKGIE